MTPRRSLQFLFPLLALGFVLAVAAPAHAQGGSSATLSVTFGHTPQWVSVHGTRVREIRQADRPDYDMFRYNNRYYAYHNNRWYWSRHARGRYAAMDDRYVPTELTRVPRDHWRNYPSGWGNTPDGRPRSDGRHPGAMNHPGDMNRPGDMNHRGDMNHPGDMNHDGR